MRFALFFALLASLASLPAAPQQPTTPAALPMPQRLDATPTFTLPFDLVGGLVVLRHLACNGQTGDFILDTGSNAALVVDSGPFARQLTTSTTFSRGLTGRVAVRQLAVRQFTFGAARYTAFTAPAFPLDHLRRYTGGHLLGFIGYGLLRDFEVIIDYPGRRVHFYSLHTSHPARRPFVRQDSVAFTLVRGFPVTAGFIGQTPVQLLLDTGAATNQLDTTFCRTLAPPYRPRPGAAEPLTGADGHQQLVRSSVLPEVVVGDIGWHSLQVLLARFARPANGQPLPYQGILGYPFLSQDKVVSFHYGRQQFYSLVPTPPSSPSSGAH